MKNPFGKGFNGMVFGLGSWLGLLALGYLLFGIFDSAIPFIVIVVVAPTLVDNLVEQFESGRLDPPGLEGPHALLLSAPLIVLLVIAFWLSTQPRADRPVPPGGEWLVDHGVLIAGLLSAAYYVMILVVRLRRPPRSPGGPGEPPPPFERR